MDRRTNALPTDQPTKRPTNGPTDQRIKTKIAKSHCDTHEALTIVDLNSASGALIVPLQPNVHAALAKDVTICANDGIFDFGQAYLTGNGQREHQRRR